MFSWPDAFNAFITPYQDGSKEPDYLYDIIFSIANPTLDILFLVSSVGALFIGVQFAIFAHKKIEKIMK